MTFGQWLKTQREKVGLSQEQLAYQLGCTRNTIQNIESGRTDPRYRVLKNAIDYFGAPPFWDEAKRVLFEAIVSQPATGTYG